ncbi:MAG TPA: F0F1 ATP synthase subunit delta [Candidatus Acidoferrum sp.]|nr:F0F1 ATP synthase subunit delta [Candidatus Acidoferrum sp.]
MRISKQARHQARQLFQSCQAGGLLDEDRVRQAVQLLAARQPRGYMGVLAQFHRLVKLDVARHAANIQSAADLPPPYQAQLRADLTRAYGEGLSFAFSTNPALLGGLRVQVGGDVYDGSVRARLAALRQSF